MNEKCTKIVRFLLIHNGCHLYDVKVTRLRQKFSFLGSLEFKPLYLFVCFVSEQCCHGETSTNADR